MQNVDAYAGYKWLSEAYDVAPVQPFRVRSVIGSVRSSAAANGFTVETYPAHYQPDTTLSAHLTFALKYEGVELDFLHRLFEVTGPEPIAKWALEEPTGAYARRSGFLYEWLTDSILDGVGDAGGNYVDLLGSSRYLTATVSDKVRRWRINNNLPGTRSFCPMVAFGGQGPADPAPLRAEIDSMVDQFGLETIERAVNWLTIKESKASFAIESEGKEEDRIRRLARAMSTHCGKIDSALTEAGMLEIQQAIMGEKMVGTRLGIRRSPVFVGHTNSIFEPVIDYLAPHHDMVAEMLEGLRAFEQRTRGQNPLIRAAALSFGFVYIHPLSDGNGRLSRFLINDILRRDGFLPAPVILPVSAVISDGGCRPRLVRSCVVAVTCTWASISPPSPKRVAAQPPTKAPITPTTRLRSSPPPPRTSPANQPATSPMPRKISSDVVSVGMGRLSGGTGLFMLRCSAPGRRRRARFPSSSRSAWDAGR